MRLGKVFLIKGFVMPLLIALVGIIGTVLFYVIRARNAANAVQDLMDVGNDVRLAARRFGFRRKGNQHPVDSLDDPNTAIAALGLSFIELSGLPTQANTAKLDVALRKHLQKDGATVQEMMVLGRWLNTECGTVNAAFTRMTKRVHRLTGAEHLQPLLAVLGDVSEQDQLTQQQGEALHEVKRVFRL